MVAGCVSVPTGYDCDRCGYDENDCECYCGCGNRKDDPDRRYCRYCRDCRSSIAADEIRAIEKDEGGRDVPF